MCRPLQEAPVSSSQWANATMALFFQKLKGLRKDRREGGREGDRGVRQKIKAVACCPLENKHHSVLNTASESTSIAHVSDLPCERKLTELIDSIHQEVEEGSMCTCVCIFLKKHS